jgi:hypothetical protein
VIYNFLADLVLLIHFAFVVFVLVGALLVLRWRWVMALHVPAVLWGAYVEFSGRICPLTPLEVALREHSGEGGYSGGFIDHYVGAWIYPDGLTHEVQIGLGLFVIALNVIAYAFVLRRHRARPTIPRSP